MKTSWAMVLVLVACAPPPQPGYAWNLPAWASPPSVPAGNPITQEKVSLGRALFYDRKLSGNQTYSCGTCHVQGMAFSDPHVTAIGSTGMRHPRRSSTLTNAGYAAVLTWANPLQRKLERQMLVPMFGEEPVELGLSGKEKVLVARLAADPRYPGMFARAFPFDRNPITLGNVTKAIASFERTMTSFNSPYDRYRYGHDRNAISEAAKRGERLFFSKRLDCSRCHAGPNFSDGAFHNTGLYDVHGTGRYPSDNLGVYEITRAEEDMGAFRTPTLRNVAVRAPYMHDGSIPDLDGVLDHYAAGGRTVVTGPNAGDGSENPHKDPAVHGFALNARERADLIAFLRSLTDASFLNRAELSDPNRH